MNRFYQIIDIRDCFKNGRELISDRDKCTIRYQGSVLAGVSFRDQKGLDLKYTKQQYISRNYSPYFLESTSTSHVCGTETNTSPRWMPIGGPIKGFYVIKNDEDNFQDYISDFGVYVEDPCQAVDNNITQKIGLNPAHTTSIKDLKYHAGTNSTFWLAKVC